MIIYKICLFILLFSHICLPCWWTRTMMFRLLANWSCWKRIWNVPKNAPSKANRKCMRTFVYLLSCLTFSVKQSPEDDHFSLFCTWFLPTQPLSSLCSPFPDLSDLIRFNFYRKIVELEEELRVVGNNLKSLEVSEEKVFHWLFDTFNFKSRNFEFTLPLYVPSSIYFYI